MLPFAEALKAIKQNSRKGFNETVDICVQLGIDPKRSDQAVSPPGCLTVLDSRHKHQAHSHLHAPSSASRHPALRHRSPAAPQVRGVAALPHGTGKKVTVCVFAEGAAAEEARLAGADLVGGEDLIATIKAGAPQRSPSTRHARRRHALCQLLHARPSFFSFLPEVICCRKPSTVAPPSNPRPPADS